MASIEIYHNNKRFINALTLLTFLAACIIIFLFDPVTAAFYPPCVFKKLTGFNCPGCGSSRAIHQLTHGNILQAMDYNMLVVIFLPVIIIGLFSFFTGRATQAWQALNKPKFFLVVITVFWLVRNLPLEPFRILNADH